MCDVDNRNGPERKRQEDQWKDVVRSGDISTAIRAAANAEREYKRVAKALQEWAVKMHNFEKERKESVATLKEFSRNAERLMGESMRVSLLNCADEVTDEDVNIVTDDDRWCALLARIAKADTMNQVKMTFAAYKVAVSSIGSFEGKIAGLRAKLSMNSGASDAEKETSERMLMRLIFACDQITKRKEVLIELNLKAEARIQKWLKGHIINTKASRDLTDEEKAALAGLV